MKFSETLKKMSAKNIAKPTKTVCRSTGLKCRITIQRPIVRMDIKTVQVRMLDLCSDRIL